MLIRHLGKNKTIAIISRDFFQLNLQTIVKQFVYNYDIYSQTKVQRDYKHRLLCLLPVSKQQQQEISVDFIRLLPISNRFDTIVVFIDQLSKEVLLVPCYLTIISKGFARLFILLYYGLYSLPRAMVSDKGLQFIRQV